MHSNTEVKLKMSQLSKNLLKITHIPVEKIDAACSRQFIPSALLLRHILYGCAKHVATNIHATVA